MVTDVDYEGCYYSVFARFLFPTDLMPNLADEFDSHGGFISSESDDR